MHSLDMHWRLSIYITVWTLVRIHYYIQVLQLALCQDHVIAIQYIHCSVANKSVISEWYRQMNSDKWVQTNEFRQMSSDKWVQTNEFTLPAKTYLPIYHTITFTVSTCKIQLLHDYRGGCHGCHDCQCCNGYHSIRSPAPTQTTHMFQSGVHWSGEGEGLLFQLSLDCWLQWGKGGTGSWISNIYKLLKYNNI